MSHVRVRMRGGLASSAVLALVVTLSSGAHHAFAETDRLTRTVPLRTGQKIVIEATVGDVTIQGWDRRDVMVEIVRTVPSASAFARVPLVVEETGPKLNVRVVQLEGRKDPELRTAVTVRLPRFAKVERVRIFEGRLLVKDLAGELNAMVNRGPIHASQIRGSIRLETGIGSIALEESVLASDGFFRLRTFNGDVTLQLAALPKDVRILALTLHGRITSAIPLEHKDRFGPRFGGAVLGSGEPLLSIDVVTGNITIQAPVSALW